MSIGERLKTLRLEAGLSQRQVAETLKMSKPIVMNLTREHLL